MLVNEHFLYHDPNFYLLLIWSCLMNSTFSEVVVDVLKVIIGDFEMPPGPFLLIQLTNNCDHLTLYKQIRLA